MKIAVIIVNFNGGEHIGNCLQALESQSMRADRVLVIDNNSSDASAALVEEGFPSVELIRLEENVGFAAANNHGIGLIDDCDWVALLNPDTIAEPNWIEKFIEGQAENSEHQFFSCRLVDANDETRLDGTGDVYHVSGLVWRRDHGAAASVTRSIFEAVFSPCAAAAFYRKDWLDKVEGFDESYFCYNEDIDLAFRLRLAGASCVHLDDCAVRHVGSGITGRDSDFTVYHGHRNLVWTFFKNMPTTMLWFYLPQHLLLNIVSVIYFTLKGRPRVIFRAKWDAIKGLRAIFRKRRFVQQSKMVENSILKESIQRSLLVPYLKRHD